MKSVEKDRFMKRGYEAAERVASRIGKWKHRTIPDNVHEFAAVTVSNGLARARLDGKLPLAILQLQTRCKLDLSALFLDGTERDEAVAAFIGGCMQFLYDNPDEHAIESIQKEEELAEALENYTNPDHPEYDPDFDAQIRAMRPDWFVEDD